MAKDINDLPRLLREAARTIPGDIDRLLNEQAGDVLPAIRRDTPVGDGSTGPTGRLAGATRVQQMASGKVRFVNPLPYANTQHWGRRQLRGSPSVVKGAYFVYGPVDDAQPKIEAALVRGLEDALRRRLS